MTDVLNLEGKTVFTMEVDLECNLGQEEMSHYLWGVLSRLFSVEGVPFGAWIKLERM